jgi:SAM-dependent methyltransferase
MAAPSDVTAIDRSADYIAHLRTSIDDQCARFEVGDAQALPVETATYDVVVSGLVLNFIPQPQQAANEMARAARSGGVVAVYVWDYAGRMQLLRHFWNSAAVLDRAARDLDEGRRFPICQPAPLKELLQRAGLHHISVQPIDIAMDFSDFDDYWLPFLGGQGPAPSYVMSLSEERRSALRDCIHSALPFALDGSIPLVARAWAARGTKI